MNKNDIERLAREIYDTAKAKGWWDLDRRPLEIHALIHSEISEATEAFRAGKDPFYIEGGIKGKPEGEAVELVDAVIRILDYFAYRGWPIVEILRAKMEYNKTRPHLHGGKKA
jgi:hypothetical protein